MVELRDGAEDVRDTGETWQRSRGGFSEMKGYEKEVRGKINSLTQDKSHYKKKVCVHCVVVQI